MVVPVEIRHPFHRKPEGFALVVTLIIISLLVVVAVSFLSSSASERQTADAYTSKARAAQAAQAGVEAAEAILAQSFRDFPDSCTVWDTQQTLNTGTPSSSTVNSSYNEGTSLYLRAMPTGNNVADPQYTGQPTAANSLTGNNPNNLNCKTFKLPLISGVPGGNAQLASAPPLSVDLTQMDPSQQTDPKKIYCADLNVRRSQGDLQGAIGSPPTWTTSGTAPVGPKPARANWVNLKGSDGRITGRYAFWVEDESFRANSSLLGNTTTSLAGNTAPPDNSFRPTTGIPPKPRVLQPSDYTLLGPLTAISDTAAAGDVSSILAIRNDYPGSFFPEPLAFVHSPTDGTSNFVNRAAVLDQFRYVTTNQSGTLNLTRHGTQRLNLNAVVTPLTNPVPVGTGVPAFIPPASQTTIQTQINTIVNTLKFHLPYFGERFYRTSNPFTPTPAELNNITEVPGSPVGAGPVSSHANIYCYKVAANILDYVDPDDQPTLIDNKGNVFPQGTAESPLSESSQTLWAQGKEGAPYLQEVAVRYRPVAYNHIRPHPPLQFSLKQDYYLEFWNMTDRDIYAAPQPAAPNTRPLPSLAGATLHVMNQQGWTTYTGGSFNVDQFPSNHSAMAEPPDYVIDLTNGVQFQGAPAPQGVVFKAGQCTVITTDPDYAAYKFSGLTQATKPITEASAVTPSVNAATTYLCNVLPPAVREYTGTINSPANGFQQIYREPASNEDHDLEAFLGNGYGVIDSATAIITQPNGVQYTNTDKYVDSSYNGRGYYNDFSYSSSLFGNIPGSGYKFALTQSELGDPRTNNEQLAMTNAYSTSLGGDQNRYIYSTAADTTLGYPNGTSVKPDNTKNPWGDYYSLPANFVNPGADTAPMVIANDALSSIGQLGDVYDPARLAGTGGIAYARGGGRTFKIGQRDDRYSNDPSGNASNNTSDGVPASNGWASWRLADVFDAADYKADLIELPARLNINGVVRDNGAALLALLQGFQFQPPTSAGATQPATDPIIHGDAHGTGLANQQLDTMSTSNGYSQLVQQMTARLKNQSPASGASGPFFERGELGELGTSTNSLFGVGPGTSSQSDTALVAGVHMNQVYDHGREELVRRIMEMICTRGDTFTVYTEGQSILQPTPTAPMQVTGTHRMRLTFRLVPMDANGLFHPSYAPNPDGSTKPIVYQDYSDANPTTGRFRKPDHYAVQVLQTTTY